MLVQIKINSIFAPSLERCSSGLRGTPGKRVYDKIVSRVRIPISPQSVYTTKSYLGFESRSLRQILHLSSESLLTLCNRTGIKNYF